MSIIRNILNSTLALVNNTLPTTGSNTFVGTQTMSGSIIPAIDNTYDLGSTTYQWRDIYVSSGSLYIDGTKVLGSTNQELQITTDEGQSIKILEAGSDNIILQSADGDIQLKTSGGGNLLFDPTTGLIDVRGTLQIQDGNKITSSGGNSIQFGNDLTVTGSINTTGNINGINITSFSSSLDNRILTEKERVDAILTASDADKDSFAEIVTLINSIDTTNDTTFASFYTGSINRLNSLETNSASVNTAVSNLNTFSASVETKNTTLGTYTGSINTQLSNLNGVTSSYETKGRGIVSGSSQITLSSTTGYGSVLNQAVLTSSSPTFAGATISNTLNINSGLQFRWNGAFRGQIVDYNSYGGGGDYSPFITSETSLAFGVAGNTIKALNIASNGTSTFSGTITENSSLRYKENVETIKYGLDKVLQMRGVTYDKKNTGVKEIGVIAEEVYDILPEVVLKNEEGDIDSVSYGRIVGVLIEAIKEQQKQIEELKSLIK